MRFKPILCLAATAAIVLGSPLAARADVNYDLITAAYDGNPTRVVTLIARGANVNARDDYGYTPLMWAAQEGHVMTMGALLKRGADVNARDKQGRTALLIATVKGHTEIVKSLLAHHADPTIKASNGVSAIDYARIYHMTAISRMFQTMKTPRVTMGTPRPMPTMHTGMAPTPRPMETMRPMATPHPVATPAAPTTGNINLSAQSRDEVAKLHGKFMDHLGLRDPEAIVQKGFNQDLEDKLDQVFLALDYGHTASIPRAKVADARKLVNAAKQIAAQPDPQDDMTCRQILTSLDDMLKEIGY